MQAVYDDGTLGEIMGFDQEKLDELLEINGINHVNVFKSEKIEELKETKLSSIIQTALPFGIFSFVLKEYAILISLKPLQKHMLYKDKFI